MEQLPGGVVGEILHQHLMQQDASNALVTLEQCVLYFRQ